MPDLFFARLKLSTSKIVPYEEMSGITKRKLLNATTGVV